MPPCSRCRGTQIVGELRHFVDVRDGQVAELAAGGDGVTGAGVNGLVEDGVEQIEVGSADGQRCRRTSGAVVVDIAEPRGQCRASGPYLLNGGVYGSGGGHQPLVGGGQGIQAEDGVDRVEQFAGCAGQEFAEVGGGQERPVKLQRAGQAEARQVAVAAVRTGDVDIGLG